MNKVFVLLLSAFVLHFSSESLQVSPPSLPNEAARLYSPQAKDNLEDTLIHAINQAESSIVLFTYTLKSAKIIQALNKAALSNKRVDVIYDATSSLGVENKLSPEVRQIARGLNGLMHLKLLIIDGRHSWIGSANMTRESLKSHANLLMHLDNETFARGILLKGEQVLNSPYEQPIPPQTFTIGNQNLELRFLPDDQTAIAKIKELIRNAKKTIRVAMFTFTREDLADTLIHAARRGVQVEVVVDLSTSKSASKKIIQLLQKNEIPLNLKDTGGLMHHKFMLVDGEVLVHGSANWTKAAFKQNDDYMVIIYPLNSDQKQVMDKIWNGLYDPVLKSNLRHPMQSDTASPFKIAIFGYGKMGQMVDKVARDRGHKVTGIRKTKGHPIDLDLCNVIIDFSSADSILANIEEAGIAKKNIVIGTTGWDEEIPQVKMLIEKYQIGVLYSPNFSIGIHKFLQVVKEASSLFLSQKEYEVAGIEIHHSEKKDAPSGTAKALRDTIQIFGRTHIPEFSSVRVGKVPGTHTIYFDSNEDTITLTHTAKGREGFALGAVIAAEWLISKKGFFTLEDIL